MWRYEVAFINKDGVYQWKGFGYSDKFEKFVARLARNGMRIVDISDWDSEGVGAKLKAKYCIAE